MYIRTDSRIGYRGGDEFEHIPTGRSDGGRREWADSQRRSNALLATSAAVEPDADRLSTRASGRGHPRQFGTDHAQFFLRHGYCRVISRGIESNGIRMLYSGQQWWCEWYEREANKSIGVPLRSWSSRVQAFFFCRYLFSTAGRYLRYYVLLRTVYVLYVERYWCICNICTTGSFFLLSKKKPHRLAARPFNF